VGNENAKPRSLASRILKRLWGPLIEFGILQPKDPITIRFEKSIADIEARLKPHEKPTIVFAGRFVSFDKGTCNYLNMLVEKMPEIYPLLLSEATDIKASEIASKIVFDYIALCEAPVTKGYSKNRRVALDPRTRKLISECPVLEESVKNIKAKFPDMGSGYPEALIGYLYRYYGCLIRHLRAGGTPLLFVVWNQFTAMHQVLAFVCEQEGIPVVFTEFGVLPGTFQFESGGQMGESFPATNPEEFLTLPVTEEEIANAEKLIRHLREQKLNRNRQPRSDLVKEVIPLLGKEIPTIVYFGQNDYEGGICPYTEKSKVLHSPIFRSSDNAAEYLAHLAQKNKWNLIYKPHPAMVSHARTVELKDMGAIVVSKVDINDLIDLSDVVVTIFSQTAYIALIREKPVIMLGITQLVGKGCTYQSFQKEEIENAILVAIENGYTKYQNIAFNIHTAQLGKHYLFDDLASNDFEWGQGLSDAVGYLLGHLNCP
jgi:hypothetical protein